VLLANLGFVTDAHSAASGKGMPGIRVLPLNVACEPTVAADIKAGTAAAMQGIVESLTKLLDPPRKITETISGQALQSRFQRKLRGSQPRNWDKLVAKYKDVVPVYAAH
jgi:hypothetical protein